MKLEEIKAYAQEMMAAANIDGDDPASKEMRTRIAQQAMAVCGMPISDDEQRRMELARGSGSGPQRLDRSRH